MFSLSDAIIGASLALCGVLIAQLVAMIQSRLERDNRKHVLLRTKYEEMCLYYVESMKLPGKLLLCSDTNAILATVPQEYGHKMHLLALVYFPKLRDATEKYTESYSDLCEVAGSLFDPEDIRPLGMQILNEPKYIAARDAHFLACDELQKQIETYSADYVKA
jgi:hypothetical protein